MEKKLEDLLESFYLMNPNKKTDKVGNELLDELLKSIVSNPKFFEENKVHNNLLLEIIDDILVLDQYYLLHSIIPVYTFELDTIKILINKGHIELSELKYLSLNTYFNMDKSFITEYQDYLNWNKIILRKANVNGLVSFNVLEKKKINELNLWDLASSFQLEKKFIKKNRQKLNWEIISITNDFSNEELSDYPELINYKSDSSEKSVKPIHKVNSIFEDGFLAFDNINDTKDIIEKMVNIRKNKLDEFMSVNKNKEEIKEVLGTSSNVENIDKNNVIEETKILNHNILSNTFSQVFTIPVGNADPNVIKKEVSKLISDSKKPIEFDNNSGELILDGKTQINYTKDIFLPQKSVGLPEIELITDTPSNPLTEVYEPVKEEPSIITKLFNKIKSFFNGK